MNERREFLPGRVSQDFDQGVWNDLELESTQSGRSAGCQYHLDTHGKRLPFSCSNIPPEGAQCELPLPRLLRSSTHPLPKLSRSLEKRATSLFVHGIPTSAYGAVGANEMMRVPYAVRMSDREYRIVRGRNYVSLFKFVVGSLRSLPVCLPVPARLTQNSLGAKLCLDSQDSPPTNHPRSPRTCR